MLDLINDVSDFVVPVYCVLAVTVIVLYYAYQSTAVTEVSYPDDRVYKFCKRNRGETITWQQQMAGTWDKIARRNFYEFMIFNGAPSFLANMKKESTFGQVIEFQNDGKSCRVTATGTPSGMGPLAVVADSETTAQSFDGIAMGDRAYKQTNWYDKEKKVFYSKFTFVVEGNKLLQSRSMTPEGNLFLRAEMTKPDGRMEYFDATFRKVK